MAPRAPRLSTTVMVATPITTKTLMSEVVRSVVLTTVVARGSVTPMELAIAVATVVMSTLVLSAATVTVTVLVLVILAVVAMVVMTVVAGL